MKNTNQLIIAASIVLSVLGSVGLWYAREAANAKENLSTPSSNVLVKEEANTKENPNLESSELTMNTKVVAANTQFSFKLFSELLKRQPNDNIVVSPSSVAIALGMTYNGANGNTQQAMARTLGLQGISLDEINQTNAALSTTLENADPQVQLTIANSLWAGEGKPIKPEFRQNIQNFYGTLIQNLNFADPTAASIINDWVQKSTNNKINEIVVSGDIGLNTVFVLIDVIHFLGSWTYPFPKEATAERPFTLLDGTQKQHPMMFQEGYYSVRYYENELFQAIELPYGSGRLNMYVFLPHLGVSLNQFYDNLNVENWEKWMKQFNYDEAPLLIGLPRFKVEYDIDLKETLKALGMEIIFGQDADFSAMTPNFVSISQVKHKTFIEVNEEGTEASGATAVSVSRGSPRKIIVNRPFFCAIRDNETGTLLFMGVIVDP